MIHSITPTGIILADVNWKASLLKARRPEPAKLSGPGNHRAPKLEARGTKTEMPAEPQQVVGALKRI